MAGGQMIPDDQGYSTPRPDPTILTTEQLFREVNALEARINLQLSAADERLKAETRWTQERFSHAESERASVLELLSERIAAVNKAGEKLFEVMTERYEASGREIRTAFEASEKAVERGGAAIDKRFEAVNEFRSQLADIQRTLLPRAEGDVKIAALESKLADMKSIVDKGFTGTETRADIGAQHWGFFVGAAGLIATCILAIVAMLHIH